MSKNAELVVDLLLLALDKTAAIGLLLSTAKAEGRDVTDAELDDRVAKDDAARIALNEAIAKARG